MKKADRTKHITCEHYHARRFVVKNSSGTPSEDRIPN